VATAVAAVFLVAMVGTASAHCNQTANPNCHGCCYVNSSDGCTWCYECGDTVTQSCTFDADLLNCPVGDGVNPRHGLIVGADGITIDGAGHKITGTENATACRFAGQDDLSYADSGIYNPGYDNVVIKNLEVENFCYGIALYGTNTNTVENNTVDHCKIHHNGNTSLSQAVGASNGLHMTYTKNSTISWNEIYNNSARPSCGCGGGGNGVFMYGHSNYNNITHNNFYNNMKAGFFTKYQCVYNNITYNKATGNGLGGFILRCMMSDHNNFSYNNASYNCGVGFFIRGSNNTFWGNNATHNMNCSEYYPGRQHGCLESEPSGYVACTGGVGVKAAWDAGRNYLWGNISPNFICNNEDWDIYDDSNANHYIWLTGDYNYCTFAYQYCDNSAAACPGTPCVNLCPGSWEVDLVVTDKFETWHNATHYNVTYTVKNVGYLLTSNATNTSIKIDGAEVAIDQVPQLAPHGGSHTNTLGPFPVNTSVAVNGAGYIDRIEVCADIYNEETREDETNNCLANNFGGPDLGSTAVDWDWSDPTWKNFTFNCTIANRGNINSAASWVNFVLCNGSVTVCNETTKICSVTRLVPALAPGQSHTVTVGPFRMPCDNKCYVASYIDFNNTVPENDETDNFIQCMPSVDYPPNDPPGTSCWDNNGEPAKCGDVDGDTYTTIHDGKIVAGAVGIPIATCKWAADVDCDCFTTIQDGKIIAGAVGIPKNCCEPGCPAP